VDEAQIGRIAAEDTKRASSFVIAQLITSIVLAALLLLHSLVAAYSGLAGGLIATLANGWFTLKVFSTRNTQPVQALRSFYWAEINKLIMVGAMFIAVFVMIRPVNAAALLAAYFLVHMVPALLVAISAGKKRDTL